MPMTRICDIGERQLIEDFRSFIRPEGMIGPGDDAAVIGNGTVVTTDVEPMYSPALHAPAMREDQAERRRSREEVLQNAPERDEGLFIVPRIV